MKKSKMLRLIPLLLFSPFAITSITSCGEVYIPDTTSIRLSTNQNTVKNGNYKVNFFNEDGRRINKPVIGSVLKVTEVLPHEGYVLDSIIVGNDNEIIEITNKKEYKFVMAGEHFIEISFKKVSTK